MAKFYIIGIDDNSEPVFSSEINKIISNNSIFSGGTRHYDLVKNALPCNHVWLTVKVPLNDVFVKYDDYQEIVVFASGDPLFFGFANTIQERLTNSEIIVYPTFNSLQNLAHKIVLPYHDMVISSLTGRSWSHFDSLIIEGANKIGILTDREKSPDRIANRLISYGYQNYYMYVGEHLGNVNKEKISKLNLNQACELTFEHPNCVILIKNSIRKREFGIPDNLFNHLDNRDKMITKMGIRLLSLSMLDLRDRSVFWDIGFCTGSVSIEAKLQFPHLNIIAIEKREEGRQLIEANSRKFGAMGIDYYIDDFNDFDVSSLPPPDAVFIGGHGGKLEKIIEKIVLNLKNNGVIVFNSVSKASKYDFVRSCELNGLTITEKTKIKIDDNNAIGVIKAVKKTYGKRV